MATREKKYPYVAAYVEEMIQQGQFKPGDKLPGVRALAEQLGVTRITASKGLQRLSARGLIVCNVGSGSFVAGAGIAAAAVPRKPWIFGMLIHENADAYGMQMVKEINKAVAQHGAKLHTASADGFGEDADRAVKQFMADGCNALIIPWVPYRDLSSLAAFGGRCKMPFVLPVLIPGLETHCFEAPEVFGLGMGLGVKALCDYYRLLGATRIALLGPNTRTDAAMQEDLVAYSEYIYQHGLNNLAALVGGDSIEMDGLAVRWSEFRGKIAIISYDDLHAIRFMTAMHKLGLTAPRDFQIIGCNNSSEAAFADPPLSSLQGDYASLADSLVRCALAAAAGVEWHSHTPAANTLVIRQSCGGANRITSDIVARLAARQLKICMANECELSMPENR